MNTLYPLFRENVKRNHLIEDSDTIILGFSGGKDSVTLAYLLQQLTQDIHFHLIAAYFNHNLRTDSHDEQQWVETFCQHRSIPLVIGSKNIIEFKNDHKLNLEHAASISRYTFFKQLSSQYPNAKVATAHTKSDLTETFFIKLFRGSGLQGLSTIFHKKDNLIIRPLLLFDQDQILAFLDRNHIAFFSDYTNHQDQFLRNRIRHSLVPEIQRIEPDIHQRIFKTVSIIQAEYDYFSEQATHVLNTHLILNQILPTAILKNVHPAMQRHILREYIRRIKGNLLNIDFDHIEAIRTRHAEVKGLAIPGVELVFHKGFIFPSGTTIPGYRYTIPYIKTSFSLEIKEIERTMTFERVGLFIKNRDNYRIVTPVASVEFPLTVRLPERRDRYIKIDAAVNQKVIEMIRSAGIPSELRNLNPVLVNGDGAIIWSVGSPIADRFKVRDKREKELLTVDLTRLGILH